MSIAFIIYGIGVMMLFTHTAVMIKLMGVAVMGISMLIFIIAELNMRYRIRDLEDMVNDAERGNKQ